MNTVSLSDYEPLENNNDYYLSSIEVPHSNLIPLSENLEHSTSHSSVPGPHNISTTMAPSDNLRRPKDRKHYKLIEDDKSVQGDQKNLTASPKRKTTRKTKATSSPELESPLSQLAKSYPDALIRDMDAWVNRSSEKRQEESKERKGYITRPMNAFMLYRSAYSEVTKAWAQQNNHQVVSSVSGASWALESPNLRSKFNRLAEQEKINHRLAFPNYRFQPAKSKAEVNRKRKNDKESEDGDWAGIHHAPRKVRQGREASYPACVAPAMPTEQFHAPEYQFIPRIPTPPVHPYYVANVIQDPIEYHTPKVQYAIDANGRIVQLPQAFIPSYNQLYNRERYYLGIQNMAQDDLSAHHSRATSPAHAIDPHLVPVDDHHYENLIATHQPLSYQMTPYWEPFNAMNSMNHLQDLNNLNNLSNSLPVQEPTKHMISKTTLQAPVVSSKISGSNSAAQHHNTNTNPNPNTSTNINKNTNNNTITSTNNNRNYNDFHIDNGYSAETTTRPRSRPLAPQQARVDLTTNKAESFSSLFGLDWDMPADEIEKYIAMASKDAEGESQPFEGFGNFRFTSISSSSRVPRTDSNLISPKTTK